MGISDFIDTIETREQFLLFIEMLQHDFSQTGATWENPTVLSYLEAMGSWTEDMGNRLGEAATWKLLASILYAGTMYE